MSQSLEPSVASRCRRDLRAFGCLFALGLCLLVVQPATAAEWVRIEVAGPVAAGTPAKVTLTTFYLTQQLCAYDPQASPIVTGTWYSGSGGPTEQSFSLIAYPGGRPDASVAIPLTHRAGDSPYFDGTATFPSPGAWIVRVAGPQHWGDPESEIERCSGARIDLQVGPAGGDAPAWPWVGAIAVLVGLVAVFVARSRLAN
jgi:hypothetical protein